MSNSNIFNSLASGLQPFPNSCKKERQHGVVVFHINNKSQRLKIKIYSHQIIANTHTNGQNCLILIQITVNVMKTVEIGQCWQRLGVDSINV